MNYIVQIGGQLKMAQRRAAELEQRVAELEAKAKDAEEPELPNIALHQPTTNGHAEQVN